MKRIATLLLVMAAFAMLVRDTHAATIGYSSAFSTSGGTTHVLLPTFDESFGTLLDVELHVAGEAFGGVFVSYPPPEPFGPPSEPIDTGPIFGGVHVDVLAPGGGSFGIPGFPSLVPGEVLFPGETKFIPFAPTPLFSPPVHFGPSPEYLAPGFVDIEIVALALVPPPPPAPLFFDEITADAFGHIEIVYTYEESAAVPEPSSLAMFAGLGVMGLVAAGRRKRTA